MTEILEMNLDKSIEMNTGNGNSEFTSDKLNGALQAILIQCDSKIDIIIDSELGYNILDKRECVGSLYLPITIRAVDNYGHGLMQGEKFILNEKVKISINGAQNKDINILFRLI